MKEIDFWTREEDLEFDIDDPRADYGGCIDLEEVFERQLKQFIEMSEVEYYEEFYD